MDPSIDAEAKLTFEGRLRLLRESNQATEAVVAFVREEMAQIAGELGLSLDTDGAGMLVNHLVLALERARNGTPYVAPAEIVQLLAAELDGRPAIRHRARRLATRARQRLHADLPDSEVDFLAVHLAAILTAGQLDG
ncbi:MAG TPA: PRD domain-containing protein [Candidatus Limnocylindrales bacterium]|nr:PRD domain-containing protein [Candidatus Limnocylindrales bacterium]